MRPAGSPARRGPCAAVLGALALALTAAPVPARADTEAEIGAGLLASAIKARDTKAIARLLHERLDYAGVWFTDPACAARFTKYGEVDLRDAEAFARCLSQLKLQLSTRRSSQADGAVLTYEPGIELELTFEGPRLAWIGFLAQSFADEKIPTLSAQAFEALRKTGKTRVDERVAPALARLAETGPVTAWLKLCLDASGAVTSVSVRSESAPGAGKAFTAAVSDWTFRPFAHRGKPLPVCSLSLLSYPAASAPAVEVLPYALPVLDEPEPAPAPAPRK